MPSYVADIETDGLKDYTKVHCIAIRNTDTSEGELYADAKGYKPITQAIELLGKADLIVMHNGLNFDLPVLKKLYNFTPKCAVRDTLILSRLLFADMKERDYQRKNCTLPVKLYGSHSLAAWGWRLNILKGDYGERNEAWAEFNDEMGRYCLQDTTVTLALWRNLVKIGIAESASELEHNFQKIITKQTENGFPFDYDKACELTKELCAKREELKSKLQKEFEPIDKGYWFTPKVNNSKRGYVKGVRVWIKKLTPFNPSSRDEIAERLKAKYQWEPAVLTETGKPVIDDEILSELQYPEVKDLSEYFLIQKRLGQIAEGQQAWLKYAQNENGIYKIHGEVITIGTVTGRCAHIHPNLAQVPATGVPYGHECRSLFYAPEGYKLVGCDASGLELRCLAHYMAFFDEGAYVEKILHGDIHWANAQALGLIPQKMERDKNNEHTEYIRNKISKRFIYAYLYGAGNYRIGTICGVTGEEKQDLLLTNKARTLRTRLKEKGEKYDDETVALTLKGEKLKETFLKRIPALKILTDHVQLKVEKVGTLRGIDKRAIRVRSKRNALNTLLQSAGAIAVKKATCILWDKIRENNLEDKVQQVAHIHDEVQLLVKDGFENITGELAVQSFQDAGKYYKFRCPLDGEYKVGRTWAETH